MPDEEENIEKNSEQEFSEKFLPAVNNALQKILGFVPASQIKLATQYINDEIAEEIKEIASGMADEAKENITKNAIGEAVAEDEDDRVADAIDNFGDEDVINPEQEFGDEIQDDMDKTMAKPDESTGENETATPDQTPEAITGNQNEPTPPPTNTPGETDQTPPKNDTEMPEEETPDQTPNEAENKAENEDQTEKPNEDQPTEEDKNEQEYQNFEKELDDDFAGKNQDAQNPKQDQPNEGEDNNPPDNQGKVDGTVSQTPAEEKTPATDPAGKQKQISALQKKLAQITGQTRRKIEKKIRPLQKQISALQKKRKVLDARKNFIYIKIGWSLGVYLIKLMVGIIMVVIGLLLSATILLAFLGLPLLEAGAQLIARASASLAKDIIKYKKELKDNATESEQVKKDITALQGKIMTFQGTGNSKLAEFQNKIQKQIEDLQM